MIPYQVTKLWEGELSLADLKHCHLSISSFARFASKIARLAKFLDPRWHRHGFSATCCLDYSKRIHCLESGPSQQSFIGIGQIGLMIQQILEATFLIGLFLTYSLGYQKDSFLVILMLVKTQRHMEFSLLYHMSEHKMRHASHSAIENVKKNSILSKLLSQIAFDFD